MFLSFRELRDALNNLPDELLNRTASVYAPEYGEVFPISEVFIAEYLPKSHWEELDGVVEEDQPLLVIGPPEGLEWHEKVENPDIDTN